MLGVDIYNDFYICIQTYNNDYVMDDLCENNNVESLSHADVAADPQCGTNHRYVDINRVGIRGIKLPVKLCDAHVEQHTIMTCDVAVSLDSSRRGTHMSRLVDVIHEVSHSMSLDNLCDLSVLLCEKLESNDSYIHLKFPYFIRKMAPVSGVYSHMNYNVNYKVTCSYGYVESIVTVYIPVSSVCPCSKAISDYGAHNQRSQIIVSMQTNQSYSLEQLILNIEKQGSCELYAILKRPDEKYVTERGYDNPKFVEDIVRDVATLLDQEPGIQSYTVEVENFESIHNHSAYAVIEK